MPKRDHDFVLISLSEKYNFLTSFEFERENTIVRGIYTYRYMKTVYAWCHYSCLIKATLCLGRDRDVFPKSLARFTLVYRSGKMRCDILCIKFKDSMYYTRYLSRLFKNSKKWGKLRKINWYYKLVGIKLTKSFIPFQRN